MDIKASGLKNSIVLYEHQNKAVDKIEQKKGNLLLSHGTGSGKTLTSIAAFENLRSKGMANRALVVTPASLRTNFITNGVKKFTTQKASLIGNSQEVKSGVGVTPKDASSRYNVMSYEMFLKDPEKVIKDVGADTVIYDELHRIRNESGKGYKKIKDARKHHKNFIGLTGSLMNNSPSDLVPLVDAMTEGKHYLGSKARFESRFIKEDRKGKHIAHAGTARNLLKGYVDHFETSALGAGRMPRKIIETVDVEMSNEQEEAYRYIMKKLDPVTAVKIRFGATKLQKKDLQTMFSQMTKARQVSNALHTMYKDMPLSESAKKSPKVKLLLDDVEEHLKATSDGKAVIHSNLINGGVDVLAQGLKDRGISYGTFIGKGNKGSTESQRQSDVTSYQASKKKVLLISSAGGEGLDLKNTTMFASLDGHFNPEKVQQAEARAVRAGGQAHRKPEDRKVLVRRYHSVVPLSKTEAIQGIMANTSPSAIFQRMKDPGAPVFYNPFKRERSPDKWMAEVAKDKDILNEGMRGELRKLSSVVEYFNVDEGIEKMSYDILSAIRRDAFEGELEKVSAKMYAKGSIADKAISMRGGKTPPKLRDQIGHQTRKYVVSDSPIMEAYQREMKDDLESLPELTSPFMNKRQVAKEQEFVGDLRRYYEFASGTSNAGRLTKKNLTDRDILKSNIKQMAGGALIGLGSEVQAISEVAQQWPKYSAKERLVMAGVLSALPASMVAASAYVMPRRNNPYTSTYKKQAKKAFKYGDEQLVQLLRGLPVTEEVVKKTEHFIA